MSDDAKYYQEHDFDPPGSDDASILLDDAPPAPIDHNREWRMKDGKVIAIADMSDQHLRNALRMLYRAAFSEEMAAVSMMGNMSEDAQYGLAQIAWDMGARRPSQSLMMTRVRNHGRGLLREWRRRGFKPDAWAKLSGTRPDFIVVDDVSDFESFTKKGGM